MERRELKLRAKRKLNESNNYWRFTLINTIYLVIAFIGNLFFRGVGPDRGISSSLNFIYEIFVLFPFMGSITYILLKMCKRENYTIEDMKYGYNRYWKYVGLYLLRTVATLIGLIVFVIPGIIVFLSWSQANYILTEDNSKSIMQCLKESSSMMSGHCWEFFVFLWSFILWWLLVLFTACIGIIFFMPYFNTVMTEYYLYVKDGLNINNSRESKEIITELDTVKE